MGAMSWQSAGRAAGPLVALAGVNSGAAIDARRQRGKRLALPHFGDASCSEVNGSGTWFRWRIETPSHVRCEQSDGLRYKASNLKIPVTRENIIKAGEKRQVRSFAKEYEEKQVLGEGAFGQVAFCTHQRTGVSRAVKRIFKNSVQDYDA